MRTSTNVTWAIQMRLDAARALAVDVENPHLRALLEPDGPPLLHDLLGRAEDFGYEGPFGTLRLVSPVQEPLLSRLRHAGRPRAPTPRDSSLD